jgi:hypothetical protein
VKRIRAITLSLAIVVLSVPLTARALNLPQVPNLPIPPLLIPDICAAINGCPIQFTDYTLLVKLQEYRALVQNFANIRNIAGLQGTIQQVIGMVNVANAAPPVLRGNAAAQSVIEAVPHTADRLAAIDAQAAAADGAQQQAQAANAYASVTAANTSQIAALNALQQKQNQADIDEFSANLLTLTGGDLPADGL